ncbi:MAG: chorismate mutase [Prolixibacteraceae bacterium]
MTLELDILPLSSWMPETPYPLLIAGPCSLETEEQALSTARLLAQDPRVHVIRGGVWKPRTRPGTFEGIGSIGLEWLQKIKAETGLMVGTEVANALHAEEALKADIDVLWIGARSTTSPFVIQEIADVLKGSDKVVMVKNPMNPDLSLWMGALERLSAVGLKKLVGIHRGFTPYQETKYRNYPGWKTYFELRRSMPNLPIICDPSHIAGKREFVGEISQKAFDMGFDGLMIESHIDPSCALSDAAQQFTPADLVKLIDKLVIRQQNTDDLEFGNKLDQLRSRIDALDTEMMELLSARTEIVTQIAEYKKANNVMALQINRWSQMMSTRLGVAEKLHLNETFIKILFQLVHEDSVRQQTEIIDRED